MTRSPALVPLSHDHHHGLVAAHRLKRGEPAQAGLDLRASVEQLWRVELAPHFQQEEQILFPACTGQPLVTMTRRAMEDHLAIRTLVARIVGAHRAAQGDGRMRGAADIDEIDRGGLTTLARELGERLEQHIRFEERELFPAIQECLVDSQLKEVGEQIRRARAPEGEGGPG